jgi:putative DNA methylase
MNGLPRRRTIPRRAKIEVDLPVEELIPLAEREGNRKKPVYEVHKWWARRLGSNFRMLLLGALLPSGTTKRELWREFYRSHRHRKLVVVDPFMGGGTSIVEATKLGARTIGNDIDPVAWFVTKKEVEAVDLESLKEDFRAVERDVAPFIKRFYQHVTREGERLDVTTFFWVAVIRCGRCKYRVEAHPHYQLCLDARNKRQAVFCRSCHEVAWLSATRRSFECKRCGVQTTIFAGTIRQGIVRCECGYRRRLGDRVKLGRPLAMRLFALEVESEDGQSREFVRATARDMATYRAAAGAGGGRPIARTSIPAKHRYDKRPLTYGFKYYDELFNARQLLCLRKIYRRILRVKNPMNREYLLLAFSDSLASNNMFCAYAFGYRKLTPLFGLHAYRFVSRPVEGNVWGCTFGRGSFKKCFEKLVRGKEYCQRPFEFGSGFREKVATGEGFGAVTSIEPKGWYDGRSQSLLLNCDSADLRAIRDESADLILTDPPYYNNLPYSELSDFYYAWLRDALPHRSKRWSRRNTPHREGLFVRRLTVDEHDRFLKGMRRVLVECCRILRRDGLMVFTYHHNDRRAWIALSEALLNSGFRVTNVLPVLSEGKSGFHSDSGNIKWDAVIVCRRGEKSGQDTESTEPVIEFVRRKMKLWRARLSVTSHEPGRADRASFAYALSLWALSRSKTRDGAAIVAAIEDVARRINRDIPAPWLFKSMAGRAVKTAQLS